MKTLPSLIIDGFDAEQVWAGVQLQNKAKLEKFSKQIRDLTRHLGDCNPTVQGSQGKKNFSAKGMAPQGSHAFNLLTGEILGYREEHSDIEDDEDDLHELNMDAWPENKSKIHDDEVQSGMFV